MSVVEEVEANCGALSQTLLANAGYANEKDLERLEDQGIKGYIALAREKRLTDAREAQNRRRSYFVRSAQMVVGGAEWMDQARIGFRQFSL